MEEKIERLKEALRITRSMLINVCPPDLAEDEELLNVFEMIEEALKM